MLQISNLQKHIYVKIKKFVKFSPIISELTWMWVENSCINWMCTKKTLKCISSLETTRSCIKAQLDFPVHSEFIQIVYNILLKFVSTLLRSFPFKVEFTSLKRRKRLKSVWKGIFLKLLDGKIVCVLNCWPRKCLARSKYS